MSYTPKEWETGDIITASDLNNMETGIASVETMKLTYTVEGTVTTLDNTWKEIYDAIGSKIVYYVGIQEGLSSQNTNISAYIESEEYVVDINDILFTTDSENGHPHNTL